MRKVPVFTITLIAAVIVIVFPANRTFSPTVVSLPDRQAISARFTLPTIADLKAFPTDALHDRQACVVLGYHSVGDGGGGTFFFRQAGDDQADSGTVFAPDAGPGRWYRQERRVMTIRQFGAVGDFDEVRRTGTDDTSAITAALTVWAKGGVTLIVSPGKYRVTSPITVTFNVGGQPNGKLGAISGNLDGAICVDFAPTAGVGTIQITPGASSSTLIGTGTAFTSLSHGDHIIVGGTDYTILAVGSDTSATIYENDITTTAGTAYTVAKPLLKFHALTNVRKLTLKEFQLLGSTAYNAGALLVICGENGSDKNFDGFRIGGLTIDCPGVIGAHVLNGAFEGNIHDLEASGTDNGTVPVLKIQNTKNSGLVSSINVREPNLRGGSNCLWSNSTDIRIVGGTYIKAAHEGIACYAAAGARISGPHVEACQMSGTDNLAGQAGVYVENLGGSIVDSVYSIASGLKQTNAVRVYNAGGITLIGGINFAGISTYLYMQCAVNSAASLLGLGSADVTYTGSPSRVNYIGGGKMIANQRSVVNAFYSAPGAGATVTPDLSHGTYVDIGGPTGAFTIANPSNVTPGYGDEMILNIRSGSSTGATVSFGSAYSVGATTTRNDGGAQTIVLMYSTNNKWTERNRF